MSFERFSYKKRDYSPNEKTYDSEIDPYNPTIVEELLQGPNEWKNIQEIIRITIKALTETVKAQGETVRELEKQMPTRASKAELNSGLAMKTNITDMSKAVSEIHQSIDKRTSNNIDMTNTLKDYVQRSDFQYVMSNKANVDEMRTLLESKISHKQFSQEFDLLANKIDDVQKDISKKFNNCITNREYQVMTANIDAKVSLTEFNEQMEQKANKQSVANALHRKANRADIDSLLQRKVEQNEIEAVLDQIQSKADNREIDRILQLLDGKLDKSEQTLVSHSINTKADKTDFEYCNSGLSNLKLDYEHKMHEINRKFDSIKSDYDSVKQNVSQNLGKKADAKDLERIISGISKKADSDFVNNQLLQNRSDMTAELNEIRDEMMSINRKQEDQVFGKIEKTENLYQSINDDVYKLNQQIQTILEERRNDIEETAKFVKNISSTTKKEVQITTDRILEEIEDLKKTSEELIQRKLEKKDFIEVRSKLMSSLESKVDLSEVQGALNATQNEVQTKFTDFREETKAHLHSHEKEIMSILNKKVNVSDFNQSVNQKVDATIMNGLLSQKVNINEFEDLARKFDQVFRQNDDKVTFKEFDAQIQSSRQVVDDLQKEIVLKANIKDVCTLLDTKSNIEDVNKALIDVHRELDVKAQQDELNNIVNDQAMINESLCTENIVGRWAWKSGELKSGSAVPWEIQLANTLPDNFLWEKDKASILTVAPGLYEISFGFFAKKKPTVQILVNGDAILSAVNTNSYVVHHSSGKIKDVNVQNSKHPSGNVTGLTMVDFLVLPARARISIAYTGEVGGEGFLGLKRL